MSALTRLCPLGHLDLNLTGAYQIPGCNAEAPRSYLLDGRTAVCVKSFDILSAFTGVGLSVKPVHGDRQSLMGLF